MENILVTGGSGFIGSHLTQLLIKKNRKVTLLDDFSRGNKSYIEEITDKVKIIDGDIREKEVVKNTLKEIDIVIHLAAINGTKYFYEIPDRVLDVNIKGTFNIIEEAGKAGIKRFVFSSSSEVYGFPRSFPTKENHELQIMDPINPRFSYAGSKIAGELIVINFARKFGMEYGILRFHNVYGPKMGEEHVIPQFIKRLCFNQDFIVQGDGTQTRSFCYVSDAVEGTYLVSTKREAANQIFNIGNDQPTTINELINLLSEISNKKIKPKYDLNSKQLSGSTLKRQPDITRARKILGYEPKVNMKEGLEMTYNWYIDHFHRK